MLRVLSPKLGHGANLSESEVMPFDPAQFRR